MYLRIVVYSVDAGKLAAGRKFRLIGGFGLRQRDLIQRIEVFASSLFNGKVVCCEKLIIN
jgi:hypothetical protein